MLRQRSPIDRIRFNGKKDRGHASRGRSFLFKEKQPNEPKHMGLFESFHRLRYIDLHERSQMQAIPQDPITTFSR